MDFASIITAVANGFSKIVRTAAAAPLSFINTSLILIIFAGVGYVGYMSATNRTDQLIFFTRSAPPPLVEAQRLQESIPRDARTCAAINELGKSLDADRATYWTFSNGSYGLGGLPWNYANVHCPYVDDGIAFIPDDFDKVPNSIAAEINAVLFPDFQHTACGSWTVDTIVSPYLRSQMRAVGTDIMFECGVRDGRGIPIGKVIVSWRNRKFAPDAAKVLEQLRATSEAIGVVNTPTIPLDAP